jgi:hypothetical protein
MGASPDEDLRNAIATYLLEHLLEHHFDRFIAPVEQQALADRLFGDMPRRIFKCGQAEEPDRSKRLDRLFRAIAKAVRAKNSGPDGGTD